MKKKVTSIIKWNLAFPRKLSVLLLFSPYKLGTATPIHAFRLNLPNNISHGAGSKGQNLLNFSINQLSVTVIGEKISEKMSSNNIELCMFALG